MLVVDDNAMNQRLAVGAVSRGHYEAVLMDCEMPVMDGYTAAAEIRRREGQGRRIAIVALTASAMDGDAERARAAGMDAHVTKPIDRHELYRTLDRLLAAGPTGTGVPPADRPGAGDVDTRVIDRLHALDGTGDALRGLVELFVRDTPPMVVDLGEAAQRRDLEAVRGLAHTIAGSASALGALELRRLCSEIERDARRGALPDAERIAEVATALDQAVAGVTGRGGEAPRIS